MRIFLLLLGLFSVEAIKLPASCSDPPATLISGYKLLDAQTFMMLLCSNGERDGIDGTDSLNICLWEYCRGYEGMARAGDVNCGANCYLISRMFHKTDYVAIARRWKMLAAGKLPDADLATCEKKCTGDCGVKDCTEECGIICATHFSYANRAEYELEFNSFMVKLRDYAMMGRQLTREELVSGFRHLDAELIGKHLLTGDIFASKDANLLCRLYYCHEFSSLKRSEGSYKCSESCFKLAAKATTARKPELNIPNFTTRFKTLNADKPLMKNQNECIDECERDCEKEECFDNCYQVCYTHFSFKNRKEYEAEFNELFGRYLEYP